MYTINNALKLEKVWNLGNVPHNMSSVSPSKHMSSQAPPLRTFNCQVPPIEHYNFPKGWTVPSP